MPQRVFLRRILPTAAAIIAVLVFVFFILPRLRDSNVEKDIQPLTSAREVREEQQKKDKAPAGPSRDITGGGYAGNRHTPGSFTGTR